MIIFHVFFLLKFTNQRLYSFTFTSYMNYYTKSTLLRLHHFTLVDESFLVTDSTYSNYGLQLSINAQKINFIFLHPELAKGWFGDNPVI